MKLRISRKVIQYIITEAQKIIAAGWGDTDGDGIHGPGIIDEIGSDTPASRFMDHSLAFIRYILNILKYAMDDADDDQLPSLNDFLPPEGEV